MIDPETWAEPHRERPVAQVRGTRDWMPGDSGRLAGLERLLLDRFARAGYQAARTPVLEPTELHERKSGAGIVAQLFELADSHQARLCLRPELTAGLVRAAVESGGGLRLPLRLSVSGPVFRFVPDPQPGHAREFHQAGVELLGKPGPEGDAEVIGLADWAVRQAGAPAPTLRIGHVGLVLDVLERSGLPTSARSALIDSLSLAAAGGGDLGGLDSALDSFSGWLASAQSSSNGGGGISDSSTAGDPLFRMLVPEVAGRRSSGEILARLRRKWELARSMAGSLAGLREQVRRLAGLKGPAPEVLDRLARDHGDEAGLEDLRSLIHLLTCQGVDLSRIELDLGLSRGIGFYSRTVFELICTSASGEIEVGGGGRYDGLSRVLGGESDLPGVGFALGLERLLAAIPDRSIGSPEVWTIAPISREWLPEAFRLVARLREIEGARVVCESEGSAAVEVGPTIQVAGPIEEVGTIKMSLGGRSNLQPITLASLVTAIRGTDPGGRP